MTVPSPHTVTDEQARILIGLAHHASPSLRWTPEQREALLAGARALEREARAREYDRRGEP